MAEILGISKKEFKARRDKVLKYLKDLEYEGNPSGQVAKNAKAIFFSGEEKTYSNDVHYPFRADSDFFYLTGFTEPDAAIVLDPNSPNPFTMYVRPRDAKMEIWNGFREGLEGAKKNYGADKTFDIKDAPDEEDGFFDASDFVHSMRRIKSEAEIELMRKANQIAIQAHRVLCENVTPGVYEYELEAVLNNVFRSQGASGWSYPPIVASGANSCILHYTSNHMRLEKKSLVLVDAGCEYNYYSSDITRVHPTNGGFTTAQKDVYDVVLEAQKKAINSVKPGGSFKETHEIACSVIAEGLHGLGYIKDKNSKDELRKYYMHGTGHSLGIDVHDVGVNDSKLKEDDDDKLRSRGKYEPGIVTTIEPAIYIAKEAIGIRIEDNILVTANGHENFTEGLEK